MDMRSVLASLVAIVWVCVIPFPALASPDPSVITDAVKAYLNAEGADSSAVTFASMKTVTKACPARTRCLHTIYVLAKFTQGDSKQVALLWNSDRCVSTCYDVLLYGGGALNSQDIQQYGLDATNADTLLAP
jgi:hypothetical protein